MRKIFLALLLTLVPLSALAQEVIDRIDIVGNERVTKDTIMYYLSSREGDYYNEELLKRDFRVLWSTGFFADVKISQAAGPRGRIVTINVEETPLIKSVTYKTGRKVKEEDITNKLKEKDEYLLAFSNYNPNKIEKIRKTIEDLLAEKGLGAARVDVTANRKARNEVDVIFKIDEGPKVRIGNVEFSGKVKLAPSLLRRAFKENQPHSLLSWVGGKDVYKPAKLADDLAAVKKIYQEHGYMEATVGEPKVEEVSRRTIFFWSRPQKMMRVTVPVDAGYPYRVGEIKIEGNKVFTLSGINSNIKFVPGEIYSTKVREKSIEDLGELFRNFGHLYAQVMPIESLDPKNKIVNVTYQVFEGDPCYLHRLEFRGNIFTKDKVIRREMVIREGDIFSLAIFKNSVLRIKQLGLVDLEKDPDIKPTAADPNRFDVTVPIKELQRNNIQFTAGYSGYEGTFVAVSYTTVNFLGAGENLEISGQYGARVRNASFSFTEPYLFDLPLSAGFTIYTRMTNIPWLYDQSSKGFDINTGARVFGMWHTSLTYSLQYLDVELPDYSDLTEEEAADYSEYLTYLIDSYYQGLFGWGKYNMSSITPAIYRSTIDSPLTPTSGTMYSASFKYAGTFLGGEIDLFKPSLQFTHFQPIKRGVLSLGAHIEYSTIFHIGDTAVPFWERFFLGGERNIRGYEIYTIGPRSSTGTNVGGEKQLVMNFEAVFHVGGQESPLYLIAFHDRGNAWAQEDKINLKDLYTSTGIEARVFVPALRVPFRLIFSYNNRRIYDSDSNFAFRFAVGTTF
ncbi:MAG: outer membrane protein assembly factor BamA [Acidobacteriota bacterium]|nr:outer membrane protein assembly factor BamA [Acidobacteriota bacterium]